MRVGCAPALHLHQYGNKHKHRSAITLQVLKCSAITLQMQCGNCYESGEGDRERASPALMNPNALTPLASLSRDVTCFASACQWANLSDGRVRHKRVV